MEATEQQSRIGRGRREPMPPPSPGGGRPQERVMGRMLRDTSPEQLAYGLAWFSIGLGLAELLMPGAVARLAGGRGRHTGLMRLFGLREIATGLAIFAGGRRPVNGVWARVAGDAMDLGALGLAALSPRTHKAGVAFAMANVAAVTALDVHCAKELSKQTGRMTEDGAIRLTHSIAINKPRQELYRFWKNLENLPHFMYHLQSVQPLDERRSHWVTKAPGGTRVEWDAEITEDRPDEMLGWRSLPGSRVETAGVVRFEDRPGGRGSIVRVEMHYKPPAGWMGAALAALFNQAPGQQIRDDLKRFKQIVEIGEIVRSDAVPEGIGQMWQRPAQPPQTAPALP